MADEHEQPHRLTIRQVAGRTGLSVHTLRYYERAGLLAPIARAASGHRRYAADDLGWIELLVCLRDTDMPIREVQRFAALQREGDPTGTERRELLAAHRRAVLERQRAVARSLAGIEAKIAKYDELIERGEDR